MGASAISVITVFWYWQINVYRFPFVSYDFFLECVGEAGLYYVSEFDFQLFMNMSPSSDFLGNSHNQQLWVSDEIGTSLGVNRAA